MCPRETGEDCGPPGWPGSKAAGIGREGRLIRYVKQERPRAGSRRLMAAWNQDRCRKGNLFRCFQMHSRRKPVLATGFRLFTDKFRKKLTIIMVSGMGLEPTRCIPHAPQTCASACSATPTGFTFLLDYKILTACCQENSGNRIMALRREAGGNFTGWAALYLYIFAHTNSKRLIFINIEGVCETILNILNSTIVQSCPNFAKGGSAE